MMTRVGHDSNIPLLLSLPRRASEDWTVNLKTPKHSFCGHRARRKTSHYFQSSRCTGTWFVSLAMDRVRYHLGSIRRAFHDRIPVCQMRRKLLDCGVRSKQKIP